MTTLKDLFAGLLLVIFFPICSWAEGVKLQPVEVEAPFPMDSVFLCIFPQRDFLMPDASPMLRDRNASWSASRASRKSKPAFT